MFSFNLLCGLQEEAHAQTSVSLPNVLFQNAGFALSICFMSAALCITCEFLCFPNQVSVNFLLKLDWKDYKLYLVGGLFLYENSINLFCSL